MSGYAYQFVVTKHNFWHLDLGSSAITKTLVGLTRIREKHQTKLTLQLLRPDRSVVERPRVHQRRPFIWARKIRFEMPFGVERVEIRAVLESPVSKEVVVGSVGIGELFEAFSSYAEGSWDFGFGGLFFWPYVRWAEEGRL